MHQSMQGQPCYRSAGQMADQSRQGLSQTIGGVRTPRHLMGLAPNPSIYGIQNMYPHQGAGTYRHGQPHQIITLVNPQGPYQYSGCNGHPPAPPSPCYMSLPPSSYPPIAFGYQPFMPGPPAEGPEYYLPQMVETPMPLLSQLCGMKREKKMIKIINPKTGVNVIDELTGGHASPVVPTTVTVATETEYQTLSGTYVVAAQFAAQVAAMLTLPMGSNDPRVANCYYEAEVQRGSTCGQELYARPLENRMIFQPVGNNVLSPEAEKSSSVMKSRSRKKSKDVQKSTVDGGKSSSNLETAKGVMGSTYPQKLPDVKMSDGVIGNSLESRSLSLLSRSQSEEHHLVASLTSNAGSVARESCESYSAMSGDGFGAMSVTSFNTSTDPVLASVGTCDDDAVCSTAAVDSDSLVSASCANRTKTYLEANEEPANLGTAAEDFVKLEAKKIITILSQSASSELSHQQDSTSSGPSSFPEPHEPPCSSTIARLIPDLLPDPTSFPSHPRDPPPSSSSNAHLDYSELLPSLASLPQLHDPRRVSSLATRLLTDDDEQSATNDAGKDASQEQTDQLSSEPSRVIALSRATDVDVEMKMLEAPASDEEDLPSSEMFPSDAFDVEVSNLPDLTVEGDETVISTTLFESHAELDDGDDDGFREEYSANKTDSPPATCHLPDPVATNSSLEARPHSNTSVQNHKSTADGFSIMAAPPVVMETRDASETYERSSSAEVSMVTTNSRQIGSRASRWLSGGQDRRFGRITRLGRSYSLPMNRQYSSDTGGGGHRSFSPNNNSNGIGVGRSDGSTERLRNRTNLQMSIRSKMEDRDSIAEEQPQRRVKSPTPHRDIVQLMKVAAESRTKEQRTDGQGRIQYDRNFLLQLQFEPESLQRPASLPCIQEFVLDNPNVRSSNERQILLHQPPARKSFVDSIPPGNSTPPPQRMPPVVASGPSRAPQQRRPIHQKEQPLPRKVSQVSLQLKVQLHTTENVWKPVHKKDVPETDRPPNENVCAPRHEDNKLQEERQRQVLSQRSSQEHKGLRRPRTPGLPSRSVCEDGWRGGLTNQVDPARMKLTRHQVQDNIQLGPGGRPGFTTWQRRSSGGRSRTPLPLRWMHIYLGLLISSMQMTFVSGASSAKEPCGVMRSR